jgi:hypothetical protein
VPVFIVLKPAAGWHGTDNNSAIRTSIHSVNIRETLKIVEEYLVWKWNRGRPSARRKTAAPRMEPLRRRAPPNAMIVQFVSITSE